MYPELKKFAEYDAGYKQYCARFDRVAESRETRDEYMRWVDENIRQYGMLEGARIDIIEELDEVKEELDLTKEQLAVTKKQYEAQKSEIEKLKAQLRLAKEGRLKDR